MHSSRDLCRSSKVDKRWELKQGAVRRTYSSFGNEKAFLRRHKASCACNTDNLSPSILRFSIFDERTSLMACIPPMGEPKSVALFESVIQSEGDKANISTLVLSSMQRVKKN